MSENKQSAVITPFFYSPADTLCSYIQIFRMSELRARVMPGLLSGSRRYHFYLLLLVTEGDVRQAVDGELFRCIQGSALLIRPDQVHSFGDVHGLEGWLVLFRPEILSPGPGAVQDITGAAGFYNAGSDADVFG